MPDWGSPVSGSAWVGQNGSALCVPSSTANVKGAWSNVGTIGRSGMVALGMSWGQGITAHRTLLFDLAIGASGQEQVIFSNLMLSFSSVATASRSHCQEIVLPITLPTGSILSARCQSSYVPNAGVYPTLSSHYNIPSSWTGSEITTYGADIANSAGTTLTAGAGDFTWGAWATITASCEREEAFFVAVSPRSVQNSFNDQDGWWELAIGGAGSEQVIASGNVEATLATAIVHPQWFGPYYCQAALGQRLSGRLMRQWATNQRTLDMIVYGVR